MPPLIMRRRPLLRAAAIGGGAYYLGKRRIDSRQREDDERARIAQLEAHQARARIAAATAEGASVAGPMERLEELGELHDSGVLTDQELAQLKAKLLGG